ncbi:MAG: AAA family ATPase [Arenicella sp.]
MSSIPHNPSQVYPWNQRLWQRLTSDREHLPQSIILSGVKGLGKRQIALQYAAYILQNDSVFYHGNHPDCHVLKTENELVEGQLLSDYALRYTDNTKAKAKTVITVHQVRKLIGQVTQHPQMAEHKIILIDGADKMNVNAANALLKTLEEPVSRTTFVLVSDCIEHLPITIRSRCSVFPIHTPDTEIGLQWLKQQTDVGNAESYLAMAGRAPLLALQLIQSEHIQQIREIFTHLNALISQKSNPIEVAKQWQKYPAVEVVDMLQKLLVDISKMCLTNNAEQHESDNSHSKREELFFPVQREWLGKIAKHTNLNALFSIMEEINESKRLLATPVDQGLIIENLAFNFAKLPQNSL